MTATPADVKAAIDRHDHATGPMPVPVSPLWHIDPQGRRTPGFVGALRQAPWSAFAAAYRPAETVAPPQAYLSYLPDRVLDLGCGSGEALQVFAAAGRHAVGVDADADRVAECKAAGLEARRADMLQFLRDQPDASWPAITCFQVLEHVDADTLLEVLREVLRVLTPDGVFIAETVNPVPLQPFRMFWLDPTHRNPLFPGAMLVLARSVGFDEAWIRYASPRLPEEAALTAPDYALIARRQRRANAGPKPRIMTEVQTPAGLLGIPADDEVILPVLREGRQWEPDTAKVLEDNLRPGSRFLDLGAHVGTLSLLAARLVGPGGRVVSVEADPQLAEALSNAARRAGQTQLTVWNVAAWHEWAQLTLQRHATNSGDTRTLPAGTFARTRDHAPSGTIEAWPLDAAMGDQGPWDVIKCDLQGADHLALQGLVKTLRRDRPLVLTEFWPQGILELGREPTEALRFYRDLCPTLHVLGGSQDADDKTILAAAAAAAGGFVTLVLPLRGRQS